MDNASLLNNSPEALPAATAAGPATVRAAENARPSLVGDAPVKISTRNLNFYYGEHQALVNNNLDIAANKVTAIIGPSGCGKSTHLRTYNRIFELYRNQRVSGEILLDGEDLLDPLATCWSCGAGWG